MGQAEKRFCLFIRGHVPRSTVTPTPYIAMQCTQHFRKCDGSRGYCRATHLAMCKPAMFIEQTSFVVCEDALGSTKRVQTNEMEVLELPRKQCTFHRERMDSSLRKSAKHISTSMCLLLDNTDTVHDNFIVAIQAADSPGNLSVGLGQKPSLGLSRPSVILIIFAIGAAAQFAIFTMCSKPIAEILIRRDGESTGRPSISTVLSARSGTQGIDMVRINIPSVDR